MNGTAKTREKSIIEQQKGEIQLLKEQNRMLSEELDRMRSNLEWFKRQFFGAKSEKSIRILEMTHRSASLRKRPKKKLHLFLIRIRRSRWLNPISAKSAPSPPLRN